MNLGDIKQQSKNKTNFENILNSKKDIAMNIKVRVIVFNATFKNISVISWQSVLFMGETCVP
jgi:hypothetical protein